MLCLCMKDYFYCNKCDYMLKQDQLSCDKCDNMAGKILQIHIECEKQVFIYLELFIKNYFSCDNCKYISQQEGNIQTHNETMHQS